MKILLKAKEVEKVIGKMAEAIGKEGRLDEVALVGIRSRGVPLAERLAAAILKKKGQKIPVGVLDITLYRDDLSRIAEHPVIKQTEIPFSLDSKKVYLVDDVLYTGRTIRCALDALFDLGRAVAVHLAVLVDRGGRELPIQADVVGMNYKVKPGDNIKVQLKEIDGEDRVDLE